jgi:hypothetical protein
MKNEDKKAKNLHITGLYMLHPPLAGLASVRLGHFASLHSHASLQHSLPALVLLRKSLFGLANRHIQPERYVQVF